MNDDAPTEPPPPTQPSPPSSPTPSSPAPSASDTPFRVAKLLEAMSMHKQMREAIVPPPLSRESATINEDQRRFMMERRKRRLRAAWETVPERFRWAAFAHPELKQRVKPVVFRRDGAWAHQPAVERVKFDPAKPPSLLLRGPSESGKTSLAAACMRHVLDAAIADLELGSRSGAFRVAVGMQFVTAYALAKAQIYSRLGRRPDLVDAAISASLLVIDELGMDIEVFQQSATSVREVIHERHADHRPTIVTTYLSKNDIRSQYGQGIANRLSSFHVLTLGDPK